MLVPFTELLPQALHRLGAGHITSEEALKAAWPHVAETICHKETARSCRAVSYKRGELEIVVSSAAAAAELQFSKEHALALLRKRLPKIDLRRLRIVHQ